MFLILSTLSSLHPTTFSSVQYSTIISAVQFSFLVAMKFLPTIICLAASALADHGGFGGHSGGSIGVGGGGHGGGHGGHGGGYGHQQYENTVPHYAYKVLYFSLIKYFKNQSNIFKP